ncbi:MAG: threonine synthase [Promethearchaeota archaeon]
MDKFVLTCMRCGREYPPSSSASSCGNCGGQLRVLFNLERLREVVSCRSEFLELATKGARGMWKFFDFLPIFERRFVVSMGEGDTPLVRAGRLSGDLGLELSMKLEFQNPTGSFKDRQVSVGVSNAVERHDRGVLTVSSGNVGAAVSAYAARAGLLATILVPRIAPANKIIQILAYGARVVRVDSDSSTDMALAVATACSDLKIANLMTASVVNPFINHGAKTIAYELAAHFLSGKTAELPDVVVVPVGGGGLLAFVHEGFSDLVELGVLDEAPRLLAAQPSGCAPFVRAVVRGMPVEEVFEQPWGKIETMATALADDVPLDARLAIPALKESGGVALAVTEGEIVRAMRSLATREGIFCEPSSAVGLAALEKASGEGMVDRSENACLLVTGSGFKNLRSWGEFLPNPETLPLEHDWRQFLAGVLSDHGPHSG